MTRMTTTGTAILALLIGSSGLQAQGSNLQAGSPAAPAQAAGAASQAAMDSRTFINEMAVAGMAEVTLGKMAAERAANSEVRSFGQMMVKDHSRANEELQKVASGLDVQPPAELDQKHKDVAARLAKLQGAEFDREFMNAMVDGHQDVVSKLRARADGSAAAGRTGEQALTQWAKATLPTVQQHLERARDLQGKTAK
jgi:putative membrane protein